MDQTIFDMLKRDHRELLGLFDQIMHNKGGAGQSRESLFGKLMQAAMPHMKSEEKNFYGALEERAETKDMVAHAFEEHREAQQVMKQIQGMSSTEGDGWIAMVVELQKAIKHHMTEEEGKIFTTARKVLDDQQARDIGMKFQKDKETIMQESGVMATSPSGSGSKM